MSLCAYKRAKCGKVRHITTGGKESSYCAFHILKMSAFPKVLSMKDVIEGRGKSRLKMAKHRANKQKSLQDIVDPVVKDIAEQMCKLKERQIGYVLIDDVNKNLDPKKIKLKGPVEPIDFTDSKAPALRTMREIENLQSTLLIS